MRTIRLPGVRFPKWGRRHLAKWTQTGLSRFFGNVLGRPWPASFRVAGLCVALIVGLSAVGAWFLSQALNKQGIEFSELIGWTGEVVAVLWLLFVALIFLIIAILASEIRRGLLKINPRCKDPDLM